MAFFARLSLGLSLLGPWALAARADASLTAASYARDGLLAQWDGIENVGLGLAHDDATNVWHDLVGTRHLTLVAGNAAFVSNALDGVSRTSGKMASGAAACTSYMTVEFVCDRPPGTSMMMCAGNANHIICSTSSKLLAKHGGALYKTTAGRASTYAFTYTDTQPTAFYENGEQKTDTSGSDTWSTSASLWLGAYGDNRYPYVGRIFAVRLYDRVLTDGEIRKNAMIDGARFFGIPLETENLTVDVRGGGTVSADGGAPATQHAIEIDPGTEHVLTATPADGNVFVAWETEAFDLSGTNVLSATIRVAPVKACHFKAVFVPASSVDDRHVTNYIYDGLVAMWDGLDNVGYGCAHDADATVWKDLIGTRNASLVTANASFVADALNCTGSAAATEPLARAPTVRTIEVVCEAKTSGNAYLVDPGSSVRLMFSGGKMLCEYMGPLFLLPTNLATYAVTAAADGKRFHVNGNWQVARSGADYFNLSETGYIGGTGYTGKIYAVRFYDRILTSVELAHNADLDQKRFFNAPPQDADRSSRKRQDGTVEHRVRVTADRGEFVTCGDTTAAQLDFWATNGTTVALTAGTNMKRLFLGWQSTMGNLIAEEEMRSKTVTFAVTDAVQLKAQFEYGEAAYRNPTAASYVREGLVGQWDGLENVGLGLPHDALANVWKDLVGTNDMTVVSPRGVFTENALNCTSSSSSYAAGPGAAYSDLVTVEVVCDGIVSSEGFALYAGTSAKSIIVSPNRIFWAGDQYYRFSRAQTTLARVNTTCYAEGLPVERVGHDGSWGNRGTSLSFGAPSGKDDYRYYGRIYAIRLYNRALTQAELRYNYAIDSRRFFGLARPSYPGMTVVFR